MPGKPSRARQKARHPVLSHSNMKETLALVAGRGGGGQSSALLLCSLGMGHGHGMRSKPHAFSFGEA